MSVFDLRQWLADADRAGELEHVRGADAVLEIGAASQLNYRRQRPRALLFDEIASCRALIDACRPHERLADFPAVAQAGDDLLRRAAQRWPELAR